MAAPAHRTIRLYKHCNGQPKAVRDVPVFNTCIDKARAWVHHHGQRETVVNDEHAKSRMSVIGMLPFGRALKESGVECLHHQRHGNRFDASGAPHRLLKFLVLTLLQLPWNGSHERFGARF